MGLKNLFMVPAGQKVTESHLRRVLISSICSILLCMSCLVSTTWAWFTVSIENTGNEIWIGEPKIILTVGGTEYVSGKELSDNAVTLCLVHANQSDDFDKKSTLYVTITLETEEETTSVYTTLKDSNHYSAVVNIENNTGNPFRVRWSVSWFAPPNAPELAGNTIVLAAASSAQEAPEGAEELPQEANMGE